jgi:hypothetical protein
MQRVTAASTAASALLHAVGACCINTNDVATCIDRVQQSACTAGKWSQGASCTTVNCRSPVGSCCEVPSGKCTDGVTRSQCPNRHSWLLAGQCGKEGWCVGGCCNQAASNCTETTASKCQQPAKWSLYSKCDKEYCPYDVSCRPRGLLIVAVLTKLAEYAVLHGACWGSKRVDHVSANRTPALHVCALRYLTPTLSTHLLLCPHDIVLPLSQPPCVPSWWSCQPSYKDPCCPDYACLITYTGTKHLHHNLANKLAAVSCC